MLLDSDPTAGAEDGWAPIHNFFNVYCGQRSLIAANLLLDARAQMGQADVRGRTLLDLCKFQQQMQKEVGRSDPHLDAFVKNFLP